MLQVWSEGHGLDPLKEAILLSTLTWNLVPTLATDVDVHVLEDGFLYLEVSHNVLH